MSSSQQQTANSSTSPTIFLTGVTGFVGGTILATLYQTHPNVRVKALIRQEADAEKLQAVYPKLIPIMGTLSSLSLITSTAATADFVIHAAGDNIPAVSAMIDGLASSSTAAVDPPMPRIISLTGPRSLIDPSLPITGNARSDSRPWSDVSDADAILNLPKERMHAGADHTIVELSAARGVGTILVSPGQLWGQGKAYLKKESHSALYYATVKSRERAFVIGDGSAAWSWVSIGDLGNAVVFLMEQALRNGPERRQRVGVNGDGYYFVQTGDVTLMERAKAVSERLGLGEIESISIEDAAKIHPFGPIMWGCGERIRSDKLASLGWRPKQADWRVLMEEAGGGRA